MVGRVSSFISPLTFCVSSATIPRHRLVVGLPVRHDTTNNDDRGHCEDSYMGVKANKEDLQWLEP